MWHDYYLDFGTEAAYLPAANTCEGLNYAEDVIGPILGTGYHVNLRLRDADLPPALVPFQVFPETPERVWA